MDKPIGFSTGILYKANIPINERLVLFRKFGCKAVELGYVRKERLETDPLDDIDLKTLKEYSWVSFHAPVDGVRYGDNQESLQILKSIGTLHKRFPLNLVVFHPDSFDDFTVLKEVPFPVGLENMDAKKISFQKPDILLPVFEQFPQFNLVLDVNHCYTNDPTMALSIEFEKVFAGRIAQVHASGYQIFHEPLSETKQEIILNAIPQNKYPIILEGGVLSVETAKKEYDYIVNYFKKSNV